MGTRMKRATNLLLEFRGLPSSFAGLTASNTKLPSASSTMHHTTQIAVIGGGPAGLRAAELAATHGLRVTLFDGKPSVGRKFLVAGKGGLNLTHGEAFENFVTRYRSPDQPEGIWSSLIADFDSAAIRDWAEGLGVETFQASSGRVYPKALKAAPLLRRWISRLKDLGVDFQMNHRWSGLVPGTPPQLAFSNHHTATADAVILALGGASWPQTGSDGTWTTILKALGVPIRDLEPANCGWEHAWSPETLATAEGKPIKNIRVTANGVETHGELLVTRYGIEGGAIYQLGAVLRKMTHPEIHIDLKPTFTHSQLVAKMESVRCNFLKEAATRWKLSDAAIAILGVNDWPDAKSLAHAVKELIIPLEKPRPIAEAISSAGGVCWSALNDSLMLRDHPGIFIAGEMIDWEAPTGGYLMQGCFATGTRAGQSAATWAAREEAGHCPTSL